MVTLEIGEVHQQDIRLVAQRPPRRHETEEPGHKRVGSSSNQRLEIGRQGLRAFHTARPDPFDLVVLDIGLPAMDGWAVLERIRDLSDVPVLILTAHGNEGDKVRGWTPGPTTT